jgi:hypothetical protein
MDWAPRAAPDTSAAQGKPDIDKPEAKPPKHRAPSTAVCMGMPMPVPVQTPRGALIIKKGYTAVWPPPPQPQCDDAQEHHHHHCALQCRVVRVCQYKGLLCMPFDVYMDNPNPCRLRSPLGTITLQCPFPGLLPPKDMPCSRFPGHLRACMTPAVLGALRGKTLACWCLPGTGGAFCYAKLVADAVNAATPPVVPEKCLQSLQ